MIFIFNSGGDLIKAVPEKVYQGSNKANRIWLLAPVPQSAFVSVVYRLPNGDALPEANLTMTINESEIPFVDKDNNHYSAWYIDIDAPVTAIAGEVSLQFYIRPLGDENDWAIATPDVTLTIERGVAPLVQPPLTDSYQKLLEYIQTLHSQFLREEIKGEQGEQGEQGEKGDNGLSAYQIWLDAGNSGSEQDFLESLKGEKGDKGDKGDAGEGGGTSTDVQINGTSITKDGVANIPIARGVGNLGLVTVETHRGMNINAGSGLLELYPASENDLKSRAWYMPVTGGNLDKAVKVGITTNTEVLSDEEQEKACGWLGAVAKVGGYLHIINCMTSYYGGASYTIYVKNDRNTPYTLGMEILTALTGDYPASGRIETDGKIYTVGAISLTGQDTGVQLRVIDNTEATITSLPFSDPDVITKCIDMVIPL